MNKWLVFAGAGTVVVVGVAVLAAKDDIRRFLRMRSM
jgi:hypothetical protein